MTDELECELCRAKFSSQEKYNDHLMTHSEEEWELLNLRLQKELEEEKKKLRIEERELLREKREFQREKASQEGYRKIMHKLLERENAMLGTMDPEDRKDYLKEIRKFKPGEFEYFDKPCIACGERPSRFWLLNRYPVRLCKRCRSLIEDPDKFREFLNSQGKEAWTVYHHEGFQSFHIKIKGEKERKND